MSKGGGCQRRQRVVVVLASTRIDAWMDADHGAVISARIKKKYNLLDERMDADGWKRGCRWMQILR